MRKFMLAAVAATIILVPLGTAVQAQDSTTVIKKENPDGDRSTTIIKKHDDVNLLPVPHTEEHKTIIHKDHD